MILTKQMFEAGKSDRGGYKVAQLKALGLKWEGTTWPDAGWPRKLIGSEITEKQYAEFMELRGRNVPQRTAPDKHVLSVQQKMSERAEVGLRKYGVTTERTDLSRLDWLRHAQQEAMDFAIYLEVLIQQEQPSVSEYQPDELKKFQEEGRGVWTDYPNDVDKSAESFANELYQKTDRNLS